jgi:hypothetical protein
MNDKDKITHLEMQLAQTQALLASIRSQTIKEIAGAVSGFGSNATNFVLSLDKKEGRLPTLNSNGLKYDRRKR